MMADLQAVLMVPAAVAVAVLSAFVGSAGGRGERGALVYLLVTAAMLGLAFVVAVVLVWEVYCGGGETEAAGGC